MVLDYKFSKDGTKPKPDAEPMQLTTGVWHPDFGCGHLVSETLNSGRDGGDAKWQARVEVYFEIGNDKDQHNRTV